MTGETVYVVLRDEHNNLVRVPTHTHPTIDRGRDGGTTITGLLLQCEGLVAKSDEGDEKRLNMYGSAWLRTCDQGSADHMMDYELRYSRR